MVLLFKFESKMNFSFKKKRKERKKIITLTKRKATPLKEKKINLVVLLSSEKNIRHKQVNRIA